MAWNAWIDGQALNCRAGGSFDGLEVVDLNQIQSLMGPESLIDVWTRQKLVQEMGEIRAEWGAWARPKVVGQWAPQLEEQELEQPEFGPIEKSYSQSQQRY